jgi:hypothetical protein
VYEVTPEARSIARKLISLLLSEQGRQPSDYLAGLWHLAIHFIKNHKDILQQGELG